jgi:hypothetical protein
MFETDLDGAVEEAIVLSGSVEKTFGVGSEDLMMRRMLSHALMFRCLLLLLLLAVVTGQGGGHRHRCRSHDFNPPFCFVFYFSSYISKNILGFFFRQSVEKDTKFESITVRL